MSSDDFSGAIDYRLRPLEGRIALVFGAGVCGPGWGNGEAAAVAYADAGASVVCVDLVLERARETAALIEARGGKALALAADVADAAAVARATAATMAQFGRLDIVHNNAAISPFGDPVSMDEATWDRSFAVNTKSVFLAAKFALPIMRRQRSGVITSISSVLSTRISEYDLTSYNASKAAVDHLTRAMAVANAPYGIRVNAIQPGLMDTPQIHAHGDIVDLHGSIADTKRSRDAMSPTLKQGTGWDIGHVAVFLASDAARYVNGVVLPVDGGLSCKQPAQPHPAPDDL